MRIASEKENGPNLENNNEKSILVIKNTKIPDLNILRLLLEDYFRNYPSKIPDNDYDLQFKRLNNYPEIQYGIAFQGDTVFGTRGIIGFLPLASEEQHYEVHIRVKRSPMPFVEESYSIEVTQFVERYLVWMGKKIEDYLTNTSSAHKTNLRKDTFERHKKTWKIIKKMNRDYLHDYENGKTDNPNPKTIDYISAVAKELRRNYSERTIRVIIKKGKAGELD